MPSNNKNVRVFKSKNVINYDQYQLVEGTRLSNVFMFDFPG